MNKNEFHIIKTPKGNFNFGLYAKNKEKILNSSQVYTTKAACKAGIDSIIKNAAKCVKEDRYSDLTLKKPTESKCPKFEIYKDKADLFRYRLIAPNGECIAIAEQGYTAKPSVIKACEAVAKDAKASVIIDDSKE